MTQATRPYFIWDYDLSDVDLHQILSGEDEQPKIWVVTRLLESARNEDIWKYSSLEEVQAIFPGLPMKPQIRAVWEFAMPIWGQETNHGS